MKRFIHRASQILGMSPPCGAPHLRPNPGGATHDSANIMEFKAPHSIHPMRHPNPHRGPYGFPGLNSSFSEALGEYCHLNSLEELAVLVENFCPELKTALDRIIADGVSSMSLAVDLLQVEEATEMLQKIRELVILANHSELLVILPLPPHVFNRLARHVSTELFLTASSHMPPHLHNWPCDHIDRIMPEQLTARLNSTKAIAVEGMYKDGDLCFPTSVVKFLHIARPFYPEMRLFVHVMPHQPRHVELAKLCGDFHVYTI